MKEAYYELNKEVNGLVETFIRMLDKDTVIGMDPKIFITVQHCIKIVDTYNKLTEKLIDNLEKKRRKT